MFIETEYTKCKQTDPLIFCSFQCPRCWRM